MQSRTKRLGRIETNPSKLMIGLLALAASGEIPQAPGQLIESRGVRMHLNCSGTGSPSVILEAGFPGSSLDWSLVQPNVATFSRVCSYDRAGFGWSDVSKAPRSSEQIAQELYDLLSAAKVPGPYVLVGHSMGGLYVRAFARKFPESVLGLVLVDATNEDQWDFEPKRFWEPSGAPSIRLKQPEVVRPQNVSTILKEMWATERWKAGERAERDAIKITISDAQKAPRRLPAVPLIVLSAGEEIGWSDNTASGALKWQQLQKEMATLSPLGKWVPVPGANHYIHLSEPMAVVNAIRKVVQAGRAYTKAKPAP
jgi:pimeloyl-ACP methyl ester carboxylesterase